MKRSKLVIVFFVVLVFAVFSPLASVNPLEAQNRMLGDLPIIAEATPEIMQQGVGTLSYVFTGLNYGTFLRSDGSAVLYIDNWIRNDGSEPMDGHGWCFYWGQDIYSNVFAKDAFGYMDVDYYEHYSDVYAQWGLCVEVSFHHTIQNGGDYWYALGITIDDHHTVENEVIDASWTVCSSSSIENYTEKVSWPYNHEGVVADPPPDILENSFAQWTRTNAEAPWEFTVDLSITLGDQMAVDPLSQGTYPFDGQDVSWEDDDYGVNTGQTVGDWGCYLTSGTMAINYFAKILGIYDQIDPGDLNSWLATPGSPDSSVPRGYGHYREDPPGVYSLVNSFVFDEASEDLFDTTDILIRDGIPEDLGDIHGMRDNLQNGELGILNVSNDGYGHFVLVTGYTTENSVETVTINDPYEDRGSTTLLSQYNNQHGDVRWFSAGNQGARPNYVTLYANCPVELLVTDQYGRRTGYDPRTGQSYQEIPSSAYVTEYYPGDFIATSEGTKILQIESYEFSEYQVDIIGTGAGSYAIDYIAELASGETDRGIYVGTTVQGETDTLNLVYDPNVGFRHYIFLPLVLR
jgi:hypothetical protein